MKWASVSSSSSSSGAFCRLLIGKVERLVLHLAELRGGSAEEYLQLNISVPLNFPWGYNGLMARNDRFLSRIPSAGVAWLLTDEWTVLLMCYKFCGKFSFVWSVNLIRVWSKLAVLQVEAEGNWGANEMNTEIELCVIVTTKLRQDNCYSLT
jgi:hypothetical protein